MRYKVVLVFLLSFLLGGQAAMSQESKEKHRLLFFPFDVSSAGNYAYLRDGIQSMLVSRLAAKDNIEVVDRAVGEKELERLKAGTEGKDGQKQPAPADYVVEGSLYGLKGGLNVQVVLYPMVTDKEILRFSIITSTPETLIADIEQLAGEIVQSATGKTEVQQVQPGAEIGEAKGFVTAHPEAAFKKSQHSGTIIGIPGSVLKTAALGGKRNLSLSAAMTGLAIGDADGDGVGDAFVLAGGKLELYRVNGKNIEKVASTPIPKDLRCHAINAADVNGDGNPEIYLSATAGLDVASMIVQWDRGKGFSILSENIGWYLRPLNVPGKGWRLAGQKRGIEKTEFVREGVFLLDIEPGFGLREGERLPLPRKVNLFEFVYADLDGDGRHETVAIDQRGKLKVFNEANELLWVSERHFGGSKTYIGPSYGEAVNEQDRRNLSVDEDSDRELIFVPGRMLVTDVDGDRRQEIIVNENIMPSYGFVSSTIVGFFSRLKTYKEGTVVGLAWNGEAMKDLWRTGKLRGYIADQGFLILDKTLAEKEKIAVSNQQATVGRLFVGQIPSSGSLSSLLPGSDDTEITVYDLEFYTEKSE